MRYLLMISLLFVALGCERGTETERRAEERVFRAQASVSLNDGPPLFCSVAGSRLHILYLSINSRTPPAAVSVTLTHQGVRGGSTLAAIETMPLQTLSWVTAEYAEGRQPWLEARFCTLPNSAAGVAIRVRLADFGPNRGEIIALGGPNVVSFSNPLVRLRLTDEHRNEGALDPVSFEDGFPGRPPDPFHVLHLAGTRNFCPLGLRQAETQGCEPDPVLRAWGHATHRSSTTQIFGNPSPTLPVPMRPN